MAQRDWALFTVTPRRGSLLAILLLLSAAGVALLNGPKATTLRTTIGATPRAPASVLPRAGSGAQQEGKASNAEQRAAKAEAALAQAEKDKADLQNKLDASQQEIAALRERTAASSESAADSAAAPAKNA